MGAIYNIKNDGIFRINFPISFIRFKNAPLCIHAGTEPVMFGTNYMQENLKDLTGSNMTATPRSEMPELANYGIFTFISGC